MRRIMAGEATPGQIGGFLMALRTKGETADEVEGLARTMLGFANPVIAPAPAVDIVGTGGDRSGTFNISTATRDRRRGRRRAGRQARQPRRELALRLGRRARGARRDDRPRRRRGRAVPGRGRYRVPVRARCSIRRWRTPVRCAASCACRRCSTSSGRSRTRRRPFAQAVGCSDARMLPLMAEVLARRGTRAMLFRGDDGLDELTTTGPSHGLRRARRRGDARRPLDPADLGLARATLDDLQGGDAAGLGRDRAGAARAASRDPSATSCC